jgi:DNA-3-methyladenine glycosylase
MRRILGERFFGRPTPLVARALLGKFLVRKIGGKEIALMVTETEAYDGFRDRGSHASRGKTERNWPMFGPPGHWYVYFTYGMHWMLNIVTRERGYPAAVLIRGAALCNSNDIASRKFTTCDVVNGPGKLTKFLKITGKFSAKPAARSSGLWIEDRGVKIPAARIKKGPRVGIDYAGPYWARRHWRFQLTKRSGG